MIHLGPRSTILFASLALALASCGDGDGQGGQAGRGGPPTVVVAKVERQSFSDSIEAVGTAYANESVTLTSAVTERVTRVNFQDGAFVPRGAVIAELARSEETAGLAEAEARATEAAQQLERLRALQKRGFATNARVDEQVALTNAARAQAQAMRAQIGDRVIRAPFSGYISLRRISPGTVVSAGTEIATISELSRIKVDFTVPESFLGAIALGQPIEARAAAYPDEIFRGKVEGIDPVVDPITRSATVRAVLPNADRRLRPGMLITVQIRTNPREVMAVPELALIAQGSQNYVYKLMADNTATRVPVEIGARNEGMVEIRRGLSIGDRYVAEGTVKVRDGGKVQPVAALPAHSNAAAEPTAKGA